MNSAKPSVVSARKRLEALCYKCGTADKLLAWMKANGICASRGASSGGDALAASLSNFLSPGTLARVERDLDLSIVDFVGGESYAPLPEPLRTLEARHQADALPDWAYGEPVRAVRDERDWPARAG
jgi:hypothetical protein